MTGGQTNSVCEMYAMARRAAARFGRIWHYEWDDLVQEAVFAIWRARHGSRAYQWCAAINALRSLLKKTVRCREFPTEPLPHRPTEHTPVDLLVKKERVEFLCEVGLL